MKYKHIVYNLNLNLLESLLLSFLILVIVLFFVYSYLINVNFLYLFRKNQKSCTWILKSPIAHRGLHDKNNKIYENTLSAFQNAINHNYSIECDVHVTKDGKVIVHHDENIKRLTGANLNIHQMNYDELKKYKILDSNDHIPTLKDVLNLIDGKVPVFIEIKIFKQRGLEHNIEKILLSYKGKYAVISFNPLNLNYFKKNSPDILRGQLALQNYNMLPMFLSFCLSKLLLNFLSKPNFVVYEIDSLPNIGVNYFYKQKPVLAYNVCDNVKLKKAKSIVDNIIFDNIRP